MNIFLCRRFIVIACIIRKVYRFASGEAVYMA